MNVRRAIVLERISRVPSALRDLRKKFRLGLGLTWSLSAGESGDAGRLGRDI